MLLLASLNRAVFGFSPFAWWPDRIAELAEIISDARALKFFEDMLSYAKFSSTSWSECSAAARRLEMGRKSVLRPRTVERILGRKNRRACKAGGGNALDCSGYPCRLSSCLPEPDTPTLCPPVSHAGD